jgi:hypothetical protein
MRHSRTLPARLSAELSFHAFGFLPVPKEINMEAISLVSIQPLVALIFGILILIVPRLLNYLIAIYLILVGAMGLWPQLFAPG